MLDQGHAVSPARDPNPCGLRAAISGAVIVSMGTKSREVIWSGRIMGAKMRAQEARRRAQEAVREADRERGLQLPDRGIARSSDRIERKTRPRLAPGTLDLKPSHSAVKALRDGWRRLRSGRRSPPCVPTT
jgi:hypothetical protein